MTLSPSLKATVKRFAWLWGTVLGAFLIPLLMTVCYYGFTTYVPSPMGGFAFTNFSTFVHGVSNMMRHNVVWCGGLGCCGAMLWGGHRASKWRLLSCLVGVATMSYFLYQFWKNWPIYNSGVARWDFWTRCVDAVTLAPLFLAALLLFFFALLLRSSPRSATKA